MSATSVYPPIGRSIPLTKHLLLDFMEYTPSGIINTVDELKTFSLPQILSPGAHNTITNEFGNLAIPLGAGRTNVNEHYDLLFDGDDETGAVYLVPKKWTEGDPRSQAKYQLMYFQPAEGTSYVGKIERKKQRKLEGLWEAYLQKRDEIRNTQQSFDAYVMLRDILSSAKRTIATGEPMDYTINGPVFREDEYDEEYQPRETQRKTTLNLDRPLDELIRERRTVTVSKQLSKNPIKEKLIKEKLAKGNPENPKNKFI